MNIDSKKKLLIEYLLMKVDEADWHGVQDAASDLRELEIETRCMEKIHTVLKDRQFVEKENKK